MATKIFRGDAARISQVQTYLFGGTWETTDVVRVAIGSKTVDFITGSATITTFLDTLVAAWTALSQAIYPEFFEMTPTRVSSTLTLTAATGFEGVPFTVTITPLETDLSPADSQTIEGGGVATTGTAATANAGPNCWDTAANWSPSGVPVSTDDVYFQYSNVDCKYGLSQSGVTLTSLNLDQSYTGQLGLKDFNGTYYEYRAVELAIGATTQNVGKGDGTGSGMLRINNGSVATTLNVYNTGSSADSGQAALRWRGTSASNAVNISKGSVDIAYAAGHTANVSGGFNVGYKTSPDSDVSLRCGTGVTIGTLNKSGGQLETNSAITTLTQTDGTTTHLAGAITTATIRGGTFYYNPTATLTTVTVSGFGVVDFSQDMRTKTVSNPIVRYGDNATIHDPFKVVTGLVIDCKESTDLSKLDIGTNVRVTRGTPA